MNRAVACCSLIAIAASCGVRAQTAPVPASTSAPSASNSSEPYVDRLIDQGDLPALRITGNDNDEEDYVSDGQPRYLRVDAIASQSNQQGPYRRENGAALSGRIETSDYGALSFDAVLRKQPQGTSLSLIQRNMPFEQGWFANNSLGMIYTPTLSLARNQYRFYLPTFPVAGAATEWLRGNALEDHALQLQLSVGQPGIFDGLRLSGFSRLGGTIIGAGAQWNITPQWQIAVELADASKVSTVAQSGTLKGANVAPALSAAAQTTSAHSVYAAAAWHDLNQSVQANWVTSNLSSSGGSAHPGGQASGLWIDAVMLDDRVTHTYGLFRLDPNLSWGYTPISGDTEGAYYRAAYRSRQWLVDGGLDYARSISGNGLDGTLWTGSARYQINRDIGVGSSATYRHSTQNALVGSLFADQVNAYGVGRLQLDHSSQDDNQLTRLSVDQAWDREVGSRLTTTLSIGQEKSGNQHFKHFGAALSGGGELLSNLSWDGNFGYDTTTGANAVKSISANIGINARLSARWSLSGTYFDNRSENTNLFIVSPVIPVAQPQVIVRSRIIFIALRYEERAGTRTAPLGGTVGSGAGSIVGRLFFDANDNGIQDANEQGAANVTLLLDERFATRTDAQGRYEFALVASGPHRISVIPDNLPLPWSIPNQGRINVTVRTRQISNKDIAASRMR